MFSFFLSVAPSHQHISTKMYSIQLNIRHIIVSGLMNQFRFHSGTVKYLFTSSLESPTDVLVLRILDMTSMCCQKEQLYMMTPYSDLEKLESCSK